MKYKLKTLRVLITISVALIVIVSCSTNNSMKANNNKHEPYNRIDSIIGDSYYGASSNPTNNPIGGGKGYNYIVNPLDADFIVYNDTQLIATLNIATNGQIVFIPSNVEIDLTGKDHIVIPAGVTIASDRGKCNSIGALIYTNDSINGPQCPHFGLFHPQENVRITGLRIRGPDGKRRYQAYDPDTTTSYGIYCSDCNLEIDNCEISNWTRAAIFLTYGATNAKIHHNYFHNIQRTGLGYGIYVNNFCDVLVEANIFDSTRHAVAGSGMSNASYEACYNIILKGCNNGHNFDMHGYGYTSPIAGNTIIIHHNTVFVDHYVDWENNSQERPSVCIRGTPITGCWVYNNWFYKEKNSYPPPVQQWNGNGNMYVFKNWYGKRTPPMPYK